jgi:hypothetical protein
MAGLHPTAVRAAPALDVRSDPGRKGSEAGRVIGLPKNRAEALLDWLEAHGRPGRVVAIGQDSFTIEWGPPDE